MKIQLWICLVTLVILLLLIIWKYRGYREYMDTKPVVRPPQKVDIPSFITKVDKCDYPLAIQYGKIFAKDDQINEFFRRTDTMLCSEKNLGNISNQAEVCGYITDLSNAYSGKMLDTCPTSINYDGDYLNQISVCKLPIYYSNYVQFMNDHKNELDIPKDVNITEQFRIEILDPLNAKCSQGNRNACIIGNALIGNMPSYCSIKSSPSPSPPPPIPIIPPAVIAGKVTI